MKIIYGLIFDDYANLFNIILEQNTVQYFLNSFNYCINNFILITND